MLHPLSLRERTASIAAQWRLRQVREELTNGHVARDVWRSIRSEVEFFKTLTITPSPDSNRGFAAI